MERIYLRKKKTFTFPELLFDAGMLFSSGCSACIVPGDAFCNEHSGLFGMSEHGYLSQEPQTIHSENCNQSLSVKCSLFSLTKTTQSTFLHISEACGSFLSRWLNYLLIGLLCVVNRFPQGSLSLPLVLLN